jgi:hypothetical protein
MEKSEGILMRLMAKGSDMRRPANEITAIHLGDHGPKDFDHRIEPMD